MKRFLLIIISLYTIFISPIFKQVIGSPRLCRYTPSCSSYTYHAISKYGAVKGLWYGMKRFLSCQPFGKVA